MRDREDRLDEDRACDSHTRIVGSVGSSSVSRVGEDFVREREALRVTLEQVGADAPTACGAWTTTDLAVHIVTGEVFRGLPNAPFRLLVRRGIRLDWMAPVNARALGRYRRRHGFDWAMERLNREAPRVQSRSGIAPVSLLEVWAHHEDVLGANDVGRCRSAIDLGPVMRVLIRYQRRFLAEHAVTVTSPEAVWYEASPTRADVRGEVADLALWLAGRAGLEAVAVSGEPEATSAVTAAVLHL